MAMFGRWPMRRHLPMFKVALELNEILCHRLGGFVSSVAACLQCPQRVAGGSDFATGTLPRTKAFLVFFQEFTDEVDLFSQICFIDRKSMSARNRERQN